MSGVWLISHVVQWALLILLAVALFRVRRGTATGAVQTAPPEGEITLGTHFPNITVQSLADQSEPLLGAPVRNRILIFSWLRCPSCEMAYPYLAQFQELALKDPAVELVLVTRAESAAVVREHFGKLNFRFRIVFSPPGARLPVRSAPYGMVLDDKNIVRAATFLGPQQSWEILARAAGLPTAPQTTPTPILVQ